MIRMLYISSATKPMSAEALLQLLETCRSNNSNKGITGMLLYCGECFIQVLEGEQQEVEALYNTIKKDSRHSNCTVLEKKHISERKFPEWSMGFKKLSDADLGDVKGLNRFFDNEAQADYFIHEQNIVGLLMQHFRKKCQAQAAHVDLPTENVSPLMEFLHKTIIELVKILAILMVFLILIGVWEAAYDIFKLFLEPQSHTFEIGDILHTFGAFMAVLIAIEIFVNITLYLRTDIIPVRLVVATALMAICRKVIVFDFHDLSPQYIYASGAVVLALGITYWLVEKTHVKHDNDF